MRAIRGEHHGSSRELDESDLGGNTRQFHDLIDPFPNPRRSVSNERDAQRSGRTHAM
jgi:hypothetical protein